MNVGKYQVKYTLYVPSFVNFVDSFVKKFNHNYGYADFFCLILNKIILQLTRKSILALTLIESLRSANVARVIPAKNILHLV